MELFPGVFQIRVPLPAGRWVSVHLLVGDRSMLIDAGLPDSPEAQILPLMRQIGFDPADLDYIVITHSDADHQGGNAALRKVAPRALIMAHELDAALVEDGEQLVLRRYNRFEAGHDLGFAEDINRSLRNWAGDPVPVDVRLRGGEQFRLAPNWTVTIWHTPGHSPGHITVYDTRHDCAIAGDCVLGTGIYDGDGRLIDPPSYHGVDWYRSAIQTLQTLNPGTLLTGHYAPMHGAEVGQFLAQTRDWVDRTEAALTRILREAAEPLTLAELSAQANRLVGPYGEGAGGMFWAVHSHLEHLERAGRVARLYKEHLVAWRWQGV